jgi:hypothetical protein
MLQTKCWISSIKLCARIISHRCSYHHNCGPFWPPLSPDLNPYNLNVRGFLKEKALPARSANLMDCSQKLSIYVTRLQKTCVVMSPQILMLDSKVIRQNVCHIEHVL